ncbi:glycoside hydrolase family 3 N-terminal domain-containing protein [Oscillibacter sp.]|uniref:glycoside hydrolase family 3 N-terminal domain-containing protein n=1 Tax=Oscillibacter sp. TaxID=1945593 RepID=UPI0026281CE6|nr:glycoside hydrolase family 3 N-terminal domain-containing protein [Oscillibacter sp.]MDD3346066.1 glycoside hydrolase family 3 N-terminal domain-containing protein [Oscillibacter sp.]
MKRPLFIFALACLLVLSGCALSPQPPAQPVPPSADSPAVPEVDQPEPDPPTAQEIADAQVETLLSSMTMEEQVGQLFFVRVPDTEAGNDVREYHLGGYILFGRNTKDKTANELIQTIQSYQDAADIPLLIGVDEEGGSVVRVSSNPHLRSEKFKSPRQLYASGGMQAVVQDTHEKDVLLKALGFNVNLAPVADVSTDPGDFIYDRTLGLGAEDTAAYTVRLTTAMTADGMGSVLKHFPGYGDNADTHTGIAVDTRPLETFEAADFLPFSAGLGGGGKHCAVLVSHNIVTCMDDQLPASLSPAVHETLRRLMKSAGRGENVVMTDDLAMDAVAAYAKDGAVAVLALKAGNDLVVTTDYRTQIPKVLEAIESGALSPETVTVACRRVLQWKQALGLLPQA